MLIEDGRIALDERVALARPRSRGAAFAALEERILRRVLRDPVQPSLASPGAMASASSTTARVSVGAKDSMKA